MNTLNTILEKLNTIWQMLTESIHSQPPLWEEYEEHYIISKPR